MSAALQIGYTTFDNVFFKLSPGVRSRIEAKVDKVDEMGLRLKTFPHHRLKGHDRYRLLVGDYRIIYTFDAERNVIHLLAIGSTVRTPVETSMRSCAPTGVPRPKTQ